MYLVVPVGLQSICIVPPVVHKHLVYSYLHDVTVFCATVREVQEKPPLGLMMVPLYTKLRNHHRTMRTGQTG